MADEKQFQESFSILANALAAALPLAQRMRRDLGEQAEDALRLEAEIERAARTVRRMRDERA
jgi:hypothetical protein